MFSIKIILIYTERESYVEHKERLIAAHLPHKKR